MLSSKYLFTPFFLQTIVIAVDELYFHYRRNLPKWERIGHPIDTFTIFICLLWVLFIPPTPISIGIYFTLSLISCLCITKDEIVHQQHCGPGEQWLHAVLFILHPIILICAGFIWPALHADRSELFGAISFDGTERLMLEIGVLIIFGFGIYQIVYWNFIWHPNSVKK